MSLLIVFRSCYEAISNIRPSITSSSSVLVILIWSIFVVNFYLRTTFPAVCDNLYWCFNRESGEATLSGRQNSDKWYTPHSSCFSQTTNMIKHPPARGKYLLQNISQHKHLMHLTIFLQDAHFRAWHRKVDHNDKMWAVRPTKWNEIQ